MAWKLELPSHGAGTPVVTGDTVFLSVVEGETVHLWSIDLGKGTVRWKKPLGAAAGHAHKKHNMASPSPSTDGKRVFAMTGTGVLKALRRWTARELWTRDLQKEYGAFGLNWGYGSLARCSWATRSTSTCSTARRPTIRRTCCGVDAATGKTRWTRGAAHDAPRRSRPTPTRRPRSRRAGGRTEIVVTGGDVVTGHDPATGKELWRAAGLNPDRRALLPDRGFAAGGGRPRDRAHARAAHARAARGRARRRHADEPCSGRSTRGPTCPRPRATAAPVRRHRQGDAVVPRPARRASRLRPPAPAGRAPTARRPCWRTGRSTRRARTALTSVVKAGPEASSCWPRTRSTTSPSPLPSQCAGGRIFLRTTHHLYCVGGAAKGAAAPAADAGR